MLPYPLDHLDDALLLRRLSELVARDRATTAELLAHIAEVDERRLYAEAGYPSMFAYCVGELHLSESAAGKRITAARASRRFPVLLTALDQGRIHLTAICVLAPHLNEENLETLIEAATHKGKAEIEAWLVARSLTTPVTIRPCTIKPIVIRPAEPAPSDAGPTLPFESLSVEPAMLSASPGNEIPGQDPGSSDRPLQHALERVVNSSSPNHYRMQLTIAKATHDKLRRVQALLGHALPTGDVAQVLDRALDLLLDHLERRKAGARRPRTASSRPTAKGYIPANVRRAVWDRDEGQCTFVSASGHRCGVRMRLEFDHVEVVARGGKATVEGIRLRCRAHNQLEADRVFGSGFMRRKRHQRARLR